MPDHPPLPTRWPTFATAALLAFAGAIHTPSARSSEPPVEVTQLLKTTHAWDGAPYRAYPAGLPEVSVLRYKIPAHTALPWHQHPVISVAYVVSGHLRLIRMRDGKTLEIGPGDVLPEVVNTEHRGQSGDEAVELIVFYAGTPGLALTLKSGPN